MRRVFSARPKRKGNQPPCVLDAFPVGDPLRLGKPKFLGKRGEPNSRRVLSDSSGKQYRMGATGITILRKKYTHFRTEKKHNCDSARNVAWFSHLVSHQGSKARKPNLIDLESQVQTNRQSKPNLFRSGVILRISSSHAFSM